MNEVEKAVWGKKTPPKGVPPAIALINPKTPANVGMVVRLASCYGFPQVWFTGNRVSLTPSKGYRLPREERMKGYKDVKIINYDNVFDQFPGATPVAIEVRENSQSLYDFEHPENPLYVFGPEDGSIPSVLLQHCHQFIVIPTRHCLNLATAVGTVLWDREVKRYWNGEIECTTNPGEWECRGIEESTDIVY
jgi:tRNA(Leu) C34 or U34 (ribose-2'-O)-methylase TrmL